MKTTYLDNEIALLKGFKEQKTASFYQLRKLEEYRKIKQLIIGGVSSQREQLSQYNEFVNMQYHGVSLDNRDIDEFNDWLNAR